MGDKLDGACRYFWRRARRWSFHFYGSAFLAAPHNGAVADSDNKSKATMRNATSSLLSARFIGHPVRATARHPDRFSKRRLGFLFLANASGRGIILFLPVSVSTVSRYAALSPVSDHTKAVSRYRQFIVSSYRFSCDRLLHRKAFLLAIIRSAKAAHSASLIHIRDIWTRVST